MGLGREGGERQAGGGEENILAEAANESGASEMLRLKRLAPCMASMDFAVAVLSSRVVEACWTELTSRNFIDCSNLFVMASRLALTFVETAFARSSEMLLAILSSKI